MSTRGLGLDGARKLQDEARLADPGFAEDGDEMGAPLPPGSLERLAKLSELAVATHERRLEVARKGGAPGISSSSLQTRSGSAGSSGSGSSSGSTRTASRTRRPGGLADHDPARARLLLEQRRPLDRVADARRSPGRGLAGRAPRRCRSRCRWFALGRERFTQLDRRPHRAQRIVLMGGRDTEHAHHAIVDEPLDRGAVPLEQWARQRAEAIPALPSKLRIDTAGSCRLAGPGDEDGDGLARGRRRDRRQPLHARRRLGRSPRSPPVRRRGRRLEGQVLVEDGGLEPTERRARLDTQLVCEHTPGLAIGLERVRLPARAVERDHELASQPLVERMLRDERLELADQLEMTSQGKLGLHACRDTGDTEILEPRDRALGKGLVDEVGERRPAPELERVAQRLGGRRRLT